MTILMNSMHFNVDFNVALLVNIIIVIVLCAEEELNLALNPLS